MKSSSGKYRSNGSRASTTAATTLKQNVMQILLILSAFVWVLAVIKVFLLEGVHTKAPSTDKPGNIVLPEPPRSNEGQQHQPNGIITTKRYQSRLDQHAELIANSKHVVVPSASEWAFIRASPAYKLSIENNAKPNGITTNAIAPPIMHHAQPQDHAYAHVVQKKIIPTNIKKAYELTWPPVQPDGNVSPSDGIDVMPILGIKVPRFWEPSPGDDMNKVGSKVNGQDTIFLMIASYRDFQCRETITSAYAKSDHPERLYVGAVDQTVPGDTGCLDIEIPCTVDDKQPICKYRDQISVFHVDASMATGPVTARHIGDRMYRGQTYVMQMDAHCMFVRHWDKQIIDQWKQTHNEMAVLSSYLTDTKGSLTAEGDSTRKTRPIMCNSDYEGMMPARYLRHGSQPEMEAAIHEMPQLQPYWAAGFSFSRGHFKLRVPYDAYMPMVFQGEEINVGIRGFTHGYDFYAPRDSVVFHEYAENSLRRKKIPMFWEHSEAHKGEGQKSLRRATAVIGMAPDLDPTTYNHEELDRYGIGNVRKLDLFYKLFLIDAPNRKAVQLCPFVTTGDMHREFQKHLRPDGLGLDYSYLEDFDTKAELERLKQIKGPW